jgi:hypothetical protein
MSNLWKALRDVSRDVDPTVGFEPPSESAGTVRRAAAAPPVSDTDVAAAPDVDAAAAPQVEGLQAGSPAPGEVGEVRGAVRRPPVATRRPATGPQSVAGKQRLAQLQSPIRRPSANGPAPAPAPAPSADDDNKIVRPPQFKLAGVADGSTPADAATVSKLRQALSAAARPGPAGDVPPGFEDDLPQPVAPRQAAPASPVPPRPAAPVLPRQAAPVPPRQAPPRQAPPQAAPAPPRQAPAAPPRQAPPGPQRTPAPSYAAPELPASLRPFAPGVADTQMDVTALVGSPRWHPGDDDVVPTDGRKGPQRMRLRERLGF